MTHCTIATTVRTLPELPFEAIKNTILGKKYDLTVTFIGNDRARTLNRIYRNKDYVPNVLSFPLTESSGEIYIAPKIAKREASKFDLSENGYLGYLYIHGLLHLKGLDHSEAMDALEKKYCRHFKIS
jgi:rRNA maturation RNase YbeY